MRLVVLAGEAGGRFSSETAQFLRDLANAKVREVPQLLKGRAHAAWIRRWTSMLACATARAFAVSLLEVDSSVGVDGPTPSVHAVLGDDRHAVRGQEALAEAVACQEKEKSLLADGEERLSQLRAAAKRVPPPFTVPPVPVIPDTPDKMQRMQRVIDELQCELTRLKWSWPTLAKPTLANPTLASLFCYRVWPKPTLAKPTLAKTNFGQTDFGQTDLGCPTGFDFKLQPVVFRTLALERLRLPLQLSEAACVCGTRLDSRGRHRADQSDPRREDTRKGLS